MNNGQLTIDNEVSGGMRFRYRSEDEMKDSGVEWIGKIPKEWDISRINSEFVVRNEKVSDKEFLPLSVTKQGILPQLENVAKSDNGDNRKKVCTGDFVINSRADRKGSCGVSSYFGSVSLICNVLTPQRLNSQYVHNLFRNYYFSEEFYRWGSGIVNDLWSTNIEKMKKINIPIPYVNEDIKIANFLDEKTSQFDSIISKKEALIQRLEEAKKSLISEVVTGKVKVVKTSDGYELVERKKEEMKDSGVEWFGDVPKEWDVTRLKYNLCKIGSGKTPKGGAEVYTDSGVVFIRSQNVYDYGLRLDDVVFINEEIDNEMNNSRVKFNDVLLNITGGSIGRSSLVDNTNLRANVNQHVCILRPITCKVNPTLLHIIIQSNATQLQIQALQNASNREGLNFEQIGNIVIIKSKKMQEQELIVEYIQNVTDYIYITITKTKQQIQKLKQAKQSLISEVVTGKIEILD